MNLTPERVAFFAENGIDADHWNLLGNPGASDSEIMSFALDHEYGVFTHDLDFGDILASTNARGPSVIQVRTQDPTPFAIGMLVVSALKDFAAQLDAGALVTVEPARGRSRVLPLFRRE